MLAFELTNSSWEKIKFRNKDIISSEFKKKNPLQHPKLQFKV